MKKLSTLLFALFTCIGLITAQAVDVSVIVVDDNGASVNGASITMYASTCDSAGYYNTGTTNPNGYWADSFTGCSQGYIDITVSCPNGTTQTASGYYDPTNSSLTYTVTCGTSTPTCSGYISSTMGASLGEYDFSLVGASNGPSTAYNWDFGDGNSSSLANPSNVYSSSGYYLVLLATSDNVGGTCTYIDSLYIDLASDTTCNAYFQWFATNADPYTLEFYSSAQGGTAPYTYAWDFGDNTNASTANPVHTYANEGSYVVTLTITDADGVACTSTYLVTVYGPMPQDTCYDWTLIDFGADCPGVDEVCGCDGVTYQNECIALNCFGIIDWTAGPCNGNGNGGGGTPIDSCNYNVSVGFQYTSTTTFGFEFWGDATSDGNLPFDYYWDFGDGTTATGENVIYTFATDSTGQDSILAFTVCLTAIDSSTCGAIACETIVISVDPIGNFAGVIVEGANLQGGTGQVEKVTGPGDPMEGVEVLLLNAAGTQVGISTTNALGEYDFDELHFGNYIIKVNIPGITHDGESLKLTPVVQTVPALNFAVTSTGVTTGIEATTFINTFEVTPNPTFGQVNLTIEMVETMEIQMTVTNLLGQSVMNQSLNLAKGEQTINLDLVGKANGIYLVSLRSGKEVITKKIVKQ